jgi:hypothetical protein
MIAACGDDATSHRATVVPPQATEGVGTGSGLGGRRQPGFLHAETPTTNNQAQIPRSTHCCPIKTHGLFDNSDTLVGAASSRDSARFVCKTSRSIAAGSRSYDNLIFHVLRADFLIRCRVAPASLTFFHLLLGQQWVLLTIFHRQQSGTSLTAASLYRVNPCPGASGLLVNDGFGVEITVQRLRSEVPSIA